ncbi:MAG: NAD(P)-dependent glycerol-3-phosphate dehydrogenase [Chloroflexi bacterium]|nr:NAD(P)-dependent glycerol-3-phosphate dehydrogenase [Chloroflexota bacterium]
MSKATVIGTTSWGTTLGIVLARQGLNVALWARTGEEARILNVARENTAFLPGFLFPPSMAATADVEEALKGTVLVILAVPSRTMRQNLGIAREHLTRSTLIMSASKGLEADTSLRMSQVMADELPRKLHGNICVLSGPNLAKEIAKGQLATTTVASEEEAVAKRAQEMMTSNVFRVYTNTDVIGVELGGALKHIIALGAGMADGLGQGNNAKAAFITRGLAEITRLGMAAGAQPLTFAGLACLGDLIATCSSPLSRNRYVGEQLAKGRALKEIVSSMHAIAEGLDTTMAARKMAKKLGVEMPITELTYRVLFEGLPPRQAVIELMERPPQPEITPAGG